MHKFKVGDVVKIVGAVDYNHEKWNNTDVFNNIWVNFMDKFIGKVCTVKGITKTGIDLIECNDYSFPPQSLKIIAEKKETALSLDKKYRTVDTHYPVRIICKDRKDSRLPWVGLYTASCGEEGAIYVNQEGIDLWGKKLIEEVPEVDWSKVKVDAPIWICSQTEEYEPQHFAEYKNDSVYFYGDGRSSHTSKGVTAVFKEHASLTNPNEKA